MTKNVQEIIDFFLNQRIRDKRTQQLQSEAIIGLPYIRDALFPANQNSNFTNISSLSETLRRRIGLIIFNRIVDYLKILCVNRLFVKGSLLDQILVLIEGQELKSIQLCPQYMVRNVQPIDSIKELSDYLFLNTEFPTTRSPLIDFLFPVEMTQLGENDCLQSCAQMVERVEDIDLIQSPSKIFIVDGQVLSTQAIFEAKVEYCQEENSRELWIILARFVNEHRAINNIRLLPAWLHNYVRYDNPKPLSCDFEGLCNCRDKLENLRIILGISPKQVRMEIPDANQQFLNIMTQLPIWYSSRFLQLMYITHELRVGSVVENKGIKAMCPATVEGVLQLLCTYE